MLLLLQHVHMCNHFSPLGHNHQKEAVHFRTSEVTQNINVIYLQGNCCAAIEVQSGKTCKNIPRNCFFFFTLPNLYTLYLASAYIWINICDLLYIRIFRVTHTPPNRPQVRFNNACFKVSVRQPGKKHTNGYFYRKE